MGGISDSGREGGIGAAAKAVFVTALRQGARREDAAAAAGFTLDGLYRARRRDPLFRAAWAAAWAASAAAERRAPDEAGKGGEARIVPNNRRLLQRRWMRHVRFDADRKKAFFSHFLVSCDMRAAAAYAGVSESTVTLHRRTDPGFAAEFQEAIDQAYVTLEAEALRQRLAAQQAFRAAVESGEAALLSGEISLEFDRVLKLLARLERRARRPERHAAPESRRRVWTFDDAIALLDKRLKGLGVAVPPLPLEIAARYDGADPGEDSDGGCEAPR